MTVAARRDRPQVDGLVTEVTDGHVPARVAVTLKRRDRSLGGFRCARWERLGFHPLEPDDQDQLDLYLLTSEIEVTLRRAH